MSEMMINQTIENTENIDQKALELAQDFMKKRTRQSHKISDAKLI